ncbi:tyrosine-type recombinase/integrase [Paraburkholderia heleia]|uniref:tyrosine-type recombinase/integrase n=1 Tax=Paraburkholderia heleia TaxID=634127 RepID=UPI002ADE7EDD|nr:tyrosine-type recombinase/integrase [Paraburkholderia heleia]
MHNASVRLCGGASLPGTGARAGYPATRCPANTLPLIHGAPGRALGASGLYDEVPAVFALAAARLPFQETGMRAALEAASTHWLRHGYARTLVVDNRVPLPVAQALLGHASVLTTAAYARTGHHATTRVCGGEFFEKSLAFAKRQKNMCITTRKNLCRRSIAHFVVLAAHLEVCPTPARIRRVDEGQSK